MSACLQDGMLQLQETAKSICPYKALSLNNMGGITTTYIDNWDSLHDHQL